MRGGGTTVPPRAGALPARNHSPARRSSPEGGAGVPARSFRPSNCIVSSHTGAAPVTPDTPRIGRPSKLPTHTPTV